MDIEYQLQNISSQNVIFMHINCVICSDQLDLYTVYTHTHTYTASSDVQNELSGLGVSVYNQDDFEAGVLQQIDREVTKRNAEQQRKFLMKEYSNVKHEIR